MKEDSILYQFFGSYFHQDWDLEGDCWREILRTFLKVSKENDKEEIVKEILKTIEDIKNDENLEKFIFKTCGCYYDPRPEQSVRNWLYEIQSYIKSASNPKMKADD